MTFSEDQSSTKPFLGDETGKALESPDVVWQSPTTNERIVDTQSGFLVVVREIGTRLAISVRRQLGTPPTSAILLTPDESLSLSKILASPQGTADTTTKSRLYQLANDSQDIERLRSRDSQSADSSNLGKAFLKQVPETEALSLRTANWEKLLGYKTESAWLGNKYLRLLSGLCLLTLLIAGSAYLIKYRHSLTLFAHPQPAVVEVPKVADIDNFARTYVAYMLDFNPNTYQYSQIKAMSSMTPDLMQKYWQETKFPIATDKLNELFHQPTLVVEKVVLSPPENSPIKTADVFAHIVSAGPESAKDKPTAVHLQLKIAEDKDKQLTVLEQTDLSASAH